MHGRKKKFFKGISDIFARDDNGTLTKDAKLYQDILCCLTNEGKSSFKIRELVKCLLKSNLGFRELYQGSHIPKSKRIENNIPTVLKKLDDMVRVGLMSKGLIKAEKLDINIPNYDLTPSGELLGWLLKAVLEESEKRALAIRNIFGIILPFLKSKDSSRAQFLSIFFTECMKVQVFVKNPTYFLEYSVTRPRVHNEQTVLDLFLDMPNTIY